MIKLKKILIEKEEKHRCSKIVIPTGLNFPRPRYCKNNGTIKVNGKWYCKIHDPNKEKKDKKPTEAEKIKKLAYYAKLLKKNKKK